MVLHRIYLRLSGNDDIVELILIIQDLMIHVFALDVSLNIFRIHHFIIVASYRLICFQGFMDVFYEIVEIGIDPHKIIHHAQIKRLTISRWN